MKNKFLLLIFVMSISIAFSQNRDAIPGGLNLQNLQKSAKLKQLYQEAKSLESTGTAAEINENRNAIKAAWQEINPAVAALYKPVDNGGKLPEIVENVRINGVFKPAVIKPKRTAFSGSTRNVETWGIIKTLRNNYTDGIDMDVTKSSGTIYIAAYVNNIDYGQGNDSLFVYKSVNNGNSFSVWKELAFTSPIRKIQLVSIDDQNSGDEYVVVYLLTDSHNFQAYRWNASTGDMTAQVITGDVIDFSVDRNFSNTNTVRVVGIYQKTNNTLYSARSTAGDYGLNWVDEYSLSYMIDKSDICYGMNGAIYISGVGHSSGNLYANVNSNYNDPASWDNFETIELGSNKEFLSTDIIAARKNLPNDYVIVQTSSRDTGSTDGYDGIQYKRINSANYSSGSSIQIAPANYSIIHISSWIRRESHNEEFHRTYVKKSLNGSDHSSVLTRNNAGTGPNTYLHTFDNNIYTGFAVQVAETVDHKACVAYAQVDPNNYGWGLYFEAETDLVTNHENTIDGFSMYPNPVSDILTIETSNPINNITIFNMLGQKIITSSQPQIDTSSLPAGTYVVKVTAGNQTGSYMLNKK